MYCCSITISHSWLYSMCVGVHWHTMTSIMMFKLGLKRCAARQYCDSLQYLQVAKLGIFIRYDTAYHTINPYRLFQQLKWTPAEKKSKHTYAVNNSITTVQARYKRSGRSYVTKQV